MYGSILISEFQDQTDIFARNENEFQDLLSEECVRIILDFILLAFSQNSPESCLNTIDILNLIRGIDASVEDVTKFRQIDEELELFLIQIKRSLSNSNDVSALISRFREILNYLDVNTLKNVFPQCKQGDYLDSLLEKLGELLWQEYQKYGNWEQAVRALFGEFAIPIMTIHKSKGLEYDTVIFLGLEDSAFWNYQNQQSEETCNFFVALSRTKRRVVITFSEHRCTQMYPKQKRKTIEIFYQALENSNIVDVMDFRQNQ
jgi:DNA helicase-2/ATP-dependent DNA helicase PcrA